MKQLLLAGAALLAIALSEPDANAEPACTRTAGSASVVAIRTRAEITGSASAPPEANADTACARTARWVVPTTIVELSFGGWTSDGVLRWARYVDTPQCKVARAVAPEA